MLATIIGKKVISDLKLMDKELERSNLYNYTAISTTPVFFPS